MLENRVAQVYISEKAFAKLWSYIRLAPAEISGLGEVNISQNGIPFISDLFLFEQTTSVVRTSLDPIALGKFMAQTLKSGYDRSKLRLWWHSHGWYPTVWSEKDEETIRFLRKHGYFLSLVGNKLAQYSLRVDYSTGASEQWLPLIRKPTGDVNINLQELSREVTEKIKFVPIPVEEVQCQITMPDRVI